MLFCPKCFNELKSRLVVSSVTNETESEVLYCTKKHFQQRIKPPTNRKSKLKPLTGEEVQQARVYCPMKISSNIVQHNGEQFIAFASDLGIGDNMSKWPEKIQVDSDVYIQSGGDEDSTIYVRFDEDDTCSPLRVMNDA